MQGLSRLLPSWGVLLTLALLAALPAAPAFGKLPRGYQVTRVDNPNPLSGDRFGDSIVNAGGDIDGDGPDDLIVAGGRGGGSKGRVFVLSGADGSLIREIPAPSDDIDGNGTETENESDAPTGFGASIAGIADLGTCTVAGEPAGAPGANCDTAVVPIGSQDTPDGVPEILVSAVGLDITTEGDDLGAVFIIDGASGAILKRITIPDGEATTDVGFGRAVLSPAGQPPCGGVGRGGIGDPRLCDYNGSPAVVNGDLNDRSKPDIVVGAPDYNDDSTTNAACSNGAGGGTCSGSGRVYIFYSEGLEGIPPTQYPETASMTVKPVTIKNPFAQHDDPTLDERFWAEEMGIAFAPVGDLGTCNQAGPPGSDCPATNRSRVADGQPEFTVSVPGADAGTVGDAGLVFVIDGATGVVLDTYRHPDPHAQSRFGFANYNLPAIGDVGGFDTLPDIYVPAIGASQQFLGQGRGYVLSGRNIGSNLISVLTDPTPAKFGYFGTSAAGIGDVANAEVGLDSRKEILVGAFGPVESDVGADPPINDVHVFSPRSHRLLQTIQDPDQQPGSAFGRALAPMGDTNGDGFLDFAVGAGNYDSASPLLVNRGRIYLFTSDDTPPPPPPVPARPPTQSSVRSPTLPAVAGRTIELEANRRRVARGARVRFRGVVEAFVNKVRCERNQTVEIQRRRRGSIRYRTLPARLLPTGGVRTNGTGGFSLKIKPTATYFYRARLAQSTYCLGAISPREEVVVRRRAAGKRRSGRTLR